jgi:predicted acetyltransferase
LSSPLRCRFARPDDIEEAARLTAHSFPGATRPPAWWQEQLRSPPYGGGPETLLVGELDGRIVAALQLHPLLEWVSGQALAVAGVGTVSISPTHRRQRLGAELMSAALRAARDRGDVASALYPFRTAFYQKLGYGHAGEALQYQVRPDSLPDSPERLNVELLEDDAGRNAALELYSRWVRGQTGQLERSVMLWTRLCTAQDRALVGYRGADGALDGYALVVYRPDLPRPTRYLEVEELVWTSDNARRGLYGWLSSLGDQWEQLLLRSLPSHGFGDWLREPRLPFGDAPQWGLWAPAATLLMGPMFRIVDMAGAWQRRRIAADAPMAFTVDVTDAQLEENAGRWRFAFEERAAHVERTPGTDDSADVRLDISTLARIFIGSLRPSAGLETGLLECRRPELLPALDAALTLPEPWTFDRF